MVCQAVSGVECQGEGSWGSHLVGPVVLAAVGDHQVHALAGLLTQLHVCRARSALGPRPGQPCKKRD
jgi:hypothetical protein